MNTNGLQISGTEYSGSVNDTNAVDQDLKKKRPNLLLLENEGHYCPGGNIKMTSWHRWDNMIINSPHGVSQMKILSRLVCCKKLADTV